MKKIKNKKQNSPRLRGKSQISKLEIRDLKPVISKACLVFDSEVAQTRGEQNRWVEPFGIRNSDFKIKNLFGFQNSKFNRNSKFEIRNSSPLVKEDFNPLPHDQSFRSSTNALQCVSPYRFLLPEKSQVKLTDKSPGVFAYANFQRFWLYFTYANFQSQNELFCHSGRNATPFCHPERTLSDPERAKQVEGEAKGESRDLFGYTLARIGRRQAFCNPRDSSTPPRHHVGAPVGMTEKRFTLFCSVPLRSE